MATSMALAGTISLASTSSPILGSGSIGNLTPSHTGIKYCSAGAGSATSSIHSPISTTSSTTTPNSNIIMNNITTATSGSLGKCPSSGNNNNNIGNDSNSSSSDIFGSKCKRKINFSNLGMPGRANQPATVARRNARERNRVKQVNNGFAALKQHIPIGHRSKKMSKVETLRCAVDYIRNLQGMLNIQGLGSASPAGSSVSGDIILMDDDENMEQLASPTPTPHQQQSHNHHHHQMNGVNNNQRDAFALSSSSSSSSPTSDFGATVAHLHHQLGLLQSHHSLQQQQHHHQHHHLANNNTNNRQLSLSHHHPHHHHGNSNGVSVATALIVDSNSNAAVTPNSNQLSPTSSEDASSPYTLETSNYHLASNANIKMDNNMPYDYEKYEPVSPEDEELLDAIAYWQQS